MALTPGTRLGPYEVTAQIGAGGMGEVWSATDTNLSRQVAIKILPDAFAHDLERLGRFEREAKTLASLNHPNIAAIYGLEKTDSVRALVMELVGGPTLADRIAQGPIPIDEALPIAKQIAEALEAAHEQGIIHRDLKPANIKLRPDGIVKVLDFGLAKPTEPVSAMAGNSQSPTVTTPAMTQTGMILGTAAYMSPEQARGKPVDKRTDIWAFGCVFYEMLTGRGPFGRATLSDTIAAVIAEVPDWDALPVNTPVPVRRLLRRSIEKDAARRLRDIGEARVELDEALRDPTPHKVEPPVRKIRWQPWSVVAAVALLTILLAAANVPRLRTFLTGETSLEPISSLAVLPFTNIEKNPELEYQSDGIVDRIIDRLSQLPELKVTSHRAAFFYKAQDIDVREVGRQLGVEAVLTGRVSTRGDTVTVSMELVDARDNSHIWGSRYTRTVSELVSLDAEIPVEIAGRLGLQLGGQARERLTKRQTTNSDAYRLYLQGRQAMEKWTPEGARTAIAYFERAIATDSDYALAYSGLADSYLITNPGVPHEEATKKARDATMKALALDPDLSEAHMSLAQLFMDDDWDFVAAEREFKRAIDLSPSNIEAHHMYSHYLLVMGRIDESQVETRKLVELDPLSPWAMGHVGYHQLYARQYDEAIATFRPYLLKMKDDFASHDLLGDAYYQKGMMGEAVESFLEARALTGSTADEIAALRRAFTERGMAGYFRDWIEQLKRRQHDVRTPETIAGAYARLGDKDRAFQWLEAAYAAQNPRLVNLRENVVFDKLRDDPRFADLLRRIGLPPV